MITFAAPLAICNQLPGDLQFSVQSSEGCRVCSYDSLDDLDREDDRQDGDCDGCEERRGSCAGGGGGGGGVDLDYSSRRSSRAFDHSNTANTNATALAGHRIRRSIKPGQKHKVVSVSVIRALFSCDMFEIVISKCKSFY